MRFFDGIRTSGISALEIGLSVLLLGCTSASSTSLSTPAAAPSPVTSSPPAPQTVAHPSPSPVNSNRPAVTTGQSPMTQPAATHQGQELPITAKATIGDEVIQLEVARTPAQQQMGLMYRPPLADDRGMLFVFEPARPVRFWMKNTPSPLDMVFLKGGEVQAIAANAAPCAADPCPTYGPVAPVSIDQVIELRSGRAAELGLAVGDRVDIKFLE